MSNINLGGGTVILDNATLFSYSSPWNIIGPGTLELNGYFTLTSLSNYFIVISNDINIKGINNCLININGITNINNKYPGLIQNGTISNPAFSNIIIENIGAFCTDNNPLAGGCICQDYFANGATNNIVNECYSVGLYLIGFGGGIVGAYAAANSGNLLVKNCYSMYSIRNRGGGIVGAYGAANNGNLIIEKCYSYGSSRLGTSNYAGGILGPNAADAATIGGTGSITINNCYTYVNLRIDSASGDNPGGILGYNFDTNGNINISNCYTCGLSSFISTIETYNGIIAGYSSDNITVGNLTSTNCYSEANNGNSGIWSDANANSVLNPLSAWISIAPNTEYLLKAYNEQLYNPNSHTESIYTYVAPFNSSLGAFQSDSNYDFSYNNYSTITLNGSPTTNILFDSINGQITFGTLNLDTYTVNVLCSQYFDYTTISGIIQKPYTYNINTFIFTLNNYIPPTPNVSICFPAGTPVLTDQGEIPINMINTKKHTIRGKEIVAITESIPLDSYLICIERNSLGPNIPSRRTIITKDHKVMCDKKMVRAEYLVQYIPSVYKVIYNKYKLYNVLLRDHSTMTINNMVTETMNPNHILAKIYSGNYTFEQRNKLINKLNNYNINQRKRFAVSKNVLRA